MTTREMHTDVSTSDSAGGGVANLGISPTNIMNILNVFDEYSRRFTRPPDPDKTVWDIVQLPPQTQYFLFERKLGKGTNEFEDLLIKLFDLPDFKSLAFVKIYTIFCPSLASIQQFKKKLRRKGVRLERSQIRVTFVAHRKIPEKTRNRKGLSDLKAEVDLNVYSMEERNMLREGLNITSADDICAVRDEHLHIVKSICFVSGPVYDVFIIARVTMDDNTSKTLLAKNVPFMDHHAEKEMVQQLEEIFSGYTRTRALVKMWIPFSPCFACSEIIVLFLDKMKKRGLSIKMAIAFSHLYNIKKDDNSNYSFKNIPGSDEHNLNLEGLKTLIKFGVVLKAINEEEGQDLGHAIGFEREAGIENELRNTHRNENVKSMNHFLKMIP